VRQELKTDSGIDAAMEGKGVRAASVGHGPAHAAIARADGRAEWRRRVGSALPCAEKLIEFLQQNYPGSLPRYRGEMETRRRWADGEAKQSANGGQLVAERQG